MKCGFDECNEDKRVVTAAQMKEIERKANDAGISYYQMMENAGAGAATYISKQHSVSGKRVLIFCGKGNNGGDGFVAARRLKEMGASVQLVLAEGEPKTEDAIKNYKICKMMKLPFFIAEEVDMSEAGKADIIIDAVYGTGFRGELKEPFRTLARHINASRAVVYALDIPSGVNGDSGTADEDAILADTTIVFHRLKPVHVKSEALRFCGKVVCLSIGIENYNL